jgi:hypothetical protein|tara:strand:- start:524 stop:742 length:219 start_codon:yes stop_codon:yes gene_type:complete
MLFSRARHDFRTCSCGETSVDGGQVDYVRLLFKDKPPERAELYVDATLKELYNDWNSREDKFGLIKKEDKDE